MRKKIPVLTIVLLLTIAFALYNHGQTNSAKDLNTLYKEGMDAYKAKDYATYLERFKSMDRLRPNHPVILYNLAGAHALNNQNDEAVRCLKKLILIDANPKIASDNDFANIRNSSGYKAVLKQIEQIRTPVSTSSTAFTITEKDLHPESIAYDPRHKTFYLGSVHKRKIVYLDKQGKLADFTASGQDGLDAVLGIRIDAKKRLLWATSNALPQMRGYTENDKGRTAVYLYHLDTKKLIKKYPLNDGPDHGFDDVALHPDGTVYISDTRWIYRITPGHGSYQPEPFLTETPFRSLQGIDFCGDGKKIIAADWSSGLYLVDIPAKKIVSKIGHPDDISLKGVDGLYYLKKSNSLIAIQNGIKPMRVVRLFLDGSFKQVMRWHTIERANPLFNEPTLGVVADNNFYYIANSQWNAYSKDFSIFPLSKLKQIFILKAAIEQ
jgi:hypothetical protein